MANRKLQIFRKTAVSDNFAGVPDIDKLEFNTATSVEAANIWTTRIEYVSSRDIAENSNPNQNFSESQDGGIGEGLYIIEGSYSRPELATSQVNQNFAVWDEAEQENTTFPFGRWSIISDDLPLKGTTSTGTIGLKIKLLRLWINHEVPNEGKFVLHLLKSKEAS